MRRRWGLLGGSLVVGLMALSASSSGQAPPPGPGGPLPGLTPAELSRWQVGQRAFLKVVDVPTGLGPVFNDNACAKCHGGPAGPPGAPPAGVGGGSPRMATRFGRVANGQFDPLINLGGPLIQEKGIGKVGKVNFVGEKVPPQANVVAKRRTTPLFGLGLVDAVPDAVFVQIAQHQHQVTPATAGRPAPAVDAATGAGRVGKFGWKAQEPTLFDFAADALVNELGITTPVFPQENCPQGNCQLLAANPARTNPNEMDNVSVQQLTDFMALLAPPPPGPANADTRAGQQIFAAIGCADCHLPSLQTGPSPVAALNHVTFAPYSDFLLHDMGTLGDGIVQNAAGPREMRTAPLWGLRFAPNFLHDGRARTPADAIAGHDGQGAGSRARFNTLTPAQKNQLMAFLNSL
ncbi:MAG: di-heme oxidoredictase family protein [Isosphaeraceae bacterium]